MSVETPPKSCPSCNSIISADAPGGLCPRCLMQFVAMSTGGVDFQSGDRLPPDLETVRAAFPHLEILELIGQGGMGAVFKARQTKLDRIVALKILPERLAREPLFAERFEREGRLLARLNHPNIVGVHDFGQADGLYYLMMEYVDGVNLRQAFASAQFTPQQALSIIPKICEALQFAHDEGVLHRDIKPENILLDTKGRVKIADFGIAKFSGADDKTGLTATGTTIGTPHYMAPEQIERPSDVDHRADIFSLGVVFYEMLTGELPLGRFAAPSERTTTLDARIDQVVMRALEKDRERRQQSANEVRTQVELLSSHAGDKRLENRAAAAKPPIMDSIELQPRYIYRSMIAIALVIASILLPVSIAMNLDVGMEIIATFLSMISLWLGFPGTLFGILHLQYLGRSGHRHGLMKALLASTFWPFTLAIVLYYYMACGFLMQFQNSVSDFVALIEVTVVGVLGIVGAVWGVWSTKKWIDRTRPDPRFANKDPHPVELVLHFITKTFAVIIWTLFGLTILYMMPGKIITRAMTKNNVDISQGTLPDLNLEIVKISSNENVLVIDVTQADGDSSMPMNEHSEEGGDKIANMPNRSSNKIRINFEGPNLLPDAAVLASESYQGRCFFPGEPFGTQTFELRRGQTATLAFALPDAQTALACKYRLNRELQEGGSTVYSPGQLFWLRSKFGDYTAYAEPSQ